MKTKPKTEKTQKADAPMNRSEFKDAISKMSRNELIGILCDIYYANAKDGCECDCGCGSESMKTSVKAKKSVKSSKASKKK